MASIEKKSLVDQVYHRLRSDIVTLCLPSGSRVNVNELQSSLGVSCTPIREAINRLQQEGLIVYENNVGARVLTLDIRDVEEITQLATTLHCAAARLAMKHTHHPVLAQKLAAHMAEFQAAQSPQQQVNAVHQLVKVFYDHCGNRRLDQSMLAIQGQQLLLRHLYANHGMDPKANLADFQAMLSGVEQNQPEEICKALEANAQRLAQAVCQGLG